MSSPSVLLAQVAALALLAGLIAAAPPVSAEEQAAVGLRASMETLEGEARLVAWLGVRSEGLQSRPPSGGDTTTTPWDQLIGLRLGGDAPTETPPQAPARVPTRWRVTLSQGERLIGMLRGPGQDGEALQLQVRHLGVVEVPVDAIALVERVDPTRPTCLTHRDAHPKQTQGDVAYDASDDRLTGTLIAFEKAGVLFEDAREEERRMPWDKLVTLHVAQEPDEDEASAPHLQIEVEQADGSRWITTPDAISSDTGHVTLTPRSLPGTRIKVPRADVRAIRCAGGRFVYATTLPFQATVETPAHDDDEVGVDETLQQLWRARVNQRASGCPLRAGGRTYRHGFGVYSVTRIAIPLNKAFATFRASVAIDDEAVELAREHAASGADPATALRGEIGARVLGDGKVLWQRRQIRGGEAPVALRAIDVRGVTQLVLEINRGPDNVSRLDRGNWLDPILVRAP